MKRKLALVLAASIILTPFPTAFGEDITLKPEVRVPELVATPVTTGSVEILANPKGAEIAANARFSDIASNPNKTDILRMTVEGIIKGSGGKFRPEAPITRQEALVYLVRLRGNEAAVQQRLAANAGTSQASYASNLFREYANEAITLGILTAAEDGSLDSLATREEIAVWLGRTVNLVPGFGDQNVLSSLSDANSVIPANRALVEAVLSERIMEGDTGGRFNPARQVTRSEMAKLLARSTDRLYTPRTLASIYGSVSGAVTTPRYEGGATIKESVFTIKALDGTVSTIKTTTNSKTRQNTDFAVLKNGSVGSSTQLAVGDQVELLTQGGQLILAQVYTDGSILRRLKADALKDQTLRTYYGTVDSRIQENRQLNGRLYKTDRLRIKNHTGQTFDMVVDTDALTGVRQDIIVQRNSLMGGIDLLQVGDSLEYAVKDPNILLYVTASPANASQLKGTLRLVEPAGVDGLAHLTVLDYNNAIFRYPVAGYADITTNGEFSKLTDLRYGQNILLSLNNGLVTMAQTETFTSPGYITPEGKMRSGTVQSISGTSMMLKGDDGLQTPVTLGNQTVVRKSSQTVSQSTLQPGDRVKLYYSAIDTNSPTRIEIEGKEQLIKGIYKGKLQQIGKTKNELVIREPQVLRNNQWTATGNYTQTIELDPKAIIYYNGAPIKFESLKTGFLNTDIYLALKDSYGKDTAIQALVKSGSERIHSDQINTISQAIQKFELDNRINYSFNDGTMVIRENRLVDLSALSERDSALVVSAYSQGTHTAGIISLIPGTANRIQNIYIGTLETIYSGQFVLRNFYQQEGYDFSDLNTQDELTFGYGGDTQITDVTSESPKVITPYQLFNGGYSRIENIDKVGAGLDYEHWYAIVVSDENNEAFSVMLRHKALLANQDIDDTYTSESDQRKAMDKVIEQITYTRGTVSGIDTTWKRFKLQDSADYAPFNEQWITNRTDTYVAISDTIILKNNQPIAFEDIQIGDRISAARIKANVLVLIVED